MRRLVFLFILVMSSCAKFSSEESKQLRIVSRIADQQLQRLSSVKGLFALIDWKEIYQLKDTLNRYRTESELERARETWKMVSGQMQSADSTSLFRFTNSYELNGSKYFIYELLAQDDFDFYEVELKEGKVTDLIVYSLGESLHSLVINVDKVFSGGPDLNLYESAKAALKEGRIDEAWALMTAISEENQDEFPYRQFRLKIARLYDYDLYSELVDKLKTMPFPDKYIAYLQLKKALIAVDHGDILSNITQLRKAVGPSAALMRLRADIDLDNKHYDSARAKYDSIIQMAPDLIDIYVIKMDVLLEMEKKEDAEKWFQVTTERFNVTKADWLEYLPERREFINEMMN